MIGIRLRTKGIEVNSSHDEVSVATDRAAVRLGARVAHAIAGRTTSRDFLTLCGLTIDSNDPRVRQLDIHDAPIGQQCLRCWG